MTDTGGPRCPNHAVPLADCHKGVGICPISGCHFTYKYDEHAKDTKMKVDKFVNKVKAPLYKVTQIDGEEGG